jgi:squalene-hopene/tetraprenyl-beta-curcumene cyclase
VQSALHWVTANYTVRENPGIGQDGLYYYALVFARALHAWGEPTLHIPAQITPGTNYLVQPKDSDHDWANDLIDRLAELQNEDGSFKSVGKRWMEDNPVLITAYSLLALQQAVR